MKSKPPGQRARDDEPVYCAETGALISSDQSSNVVPFPSAPRKRPLLGLETIRRPPTVDPGEDI